MAVIVQQFGNILDFVEDNRRSQFFEKGARIAPHPRLNVGVFQQDVLGLGKSVAKQSCFPRAARACDNERREVLSRFLKNTRQFS